MGRGCPIKVEWQETPEELYQLYQVEKHLKKRQRLQFLWLVHTGHSIQESCQIAGVAERSGQRYLSWYRAGGVAEVMGRAHGRHAPRPGFLTEAQKTALSEQSKKGSMKTVWEAIAWVKEEYGIEYSYEGMRGVLKRLRLNKKVPRPQHEKSDADAQTAWKKGGLVRD
jgi:transposase